MKQIFYLFKPSCLLADQSVVTYLNVNISSIHETTLSHFQENNSAIVFCFVGKNSGQLCLHQTGELNYTFPSLLHIIFLYCIKYRTVCSISM